jgi:ubiquinone biosynthesis protein COQ9
LVHWHLYTQREALKNKCADTFKVEEGKKELGVGQKVKALTWERLMGNREVVGRWQEVGLIALVFSLQMWMNADDMNPRH